MRQWTIDGPDDQLLTRSQVQRHLGIGKAALQRLITDGRFPRGVNVGQTKRPRLRWFALDVAAYLLLCQRLRIGPLDPHEEADDAASDEDE